MEFCCVMADDQRPTGVQGAVHARGMGEALLGLQRSKARGCWFHTARDILSTDTPPKDGVIPD